MADCEDVHISQLGSMREPREAGDMSMLANPIPVATLVELTKRELSCRELQLPGQAQEPARYLSISRHISETPDPYPTLAMYCKCHVFDHDLKQQKPGARSTHASLLHRRVTPHRKVVDIRVDEGRWTHNSLADVHPCALLIGRLVNRLVRPTHRRLCAISTWPWPTVASIQATPESLTWDDDGKK